MVDTRIYKYNPNWEVEFYDWNRGSNVGFGIGKEGDTTICMYYVGPWMDKCNENMVGKIQLAFLDKDDPRNEEWVDDGYDDYYDEEY